MQFTSTLLTSALFASSAMALISNDTSAAQDAADNTASVTSVVSSTPAANVTESAIETSSTSSIVPIVNSTTSFVSSTTPAVSYPAYNSTELYYVTEVVTAFTTYCPEPTEIVTNSKTYTVTGATTLTITDCPCTLVKTTDKQVAEPTTTVTKKTSAAPVATSAKATSATHSVINANGANAMIPSVAGMIGAFFLL